MTIFINGKQKRVKRPPTIDGLPVDEFIRQKADPIWLHQNEMWEYMIEADFRDPVPEEGNSSSPPRRGYEKEIRFDEDEIELPF